MRDVEDRQYMARAMELARKGSFSAHPNPRVGCVIVQGGQVVGEGWHRYAGEPHAEVNALAQAGGRARGATVYVTLEPCCHTGRTGPCSEALARAGVRRVVSAMPDPNPRVHGGGLHALAAAGIETRCGVLEDEARALNPGFLARMSRGRPYLRAKLAMSLDGRTAMASGESKWITGDHARRDVQRFRAMSDALLTGVGTVLSDDPRMDVRPEQMPECASDMALPATQPLRVIMDSRLRTPADARILQTGPTLVITAEGGAHARWQPRTDQPCQVERLAARAGRVQPVTVLERLAAWPVNEVWLEAGATLCGAFVNAGMVDELVVYCAPCLLGSEARGLMTLPGIQRLEQRIRLEIRDVSRVGPDLRIHAHPRPAAD